MVFEPTAAPSEPGAFLAWYQAQTRWDEPHNYNDPVVASERLAAWFGDMIRVFPPMNAPLRSSNPTDSKVTDYSIGSTVIYAAFSWSQASLAYSEVVRLAAAHRVGFYYVSGDSKIIWPVAEVR